MAGEQLLLRHSANHPEEQMFQDIEGEIIPTEDIDGDAGKVFTSFLCWDSAYLSSVASIPIIHRQDDDEPEMMSDDDEWV